MASGNLMNQKCTHVMCEVVTPRIQYAVYAATHTYSTPCMQQHIYMQVYYKSCKLLMKMVWVPRYPQMKDKVENYTW